MFQNREWSALYLFLMDGYVSLTSNPEAKQPVKIWRDSGAFQSVILQDLLPFTAVSGLCSSAVIEGFGVGTVHYFYPVYIFRLI